MKKKMFHAHNIHCARCGYTGEAKLNKIHMVLAGVCVLLACYFIFTIIAPGLRLQAFSNAVFYFSGIMGLFGIARLISRDERVYLCPKCGNVNYDRVD